MAFQPVPAVPVVVDASVDEGAQRNQLLYGELRPHDPSAAHSDQNPGEPGDAAVVVRDEATAEEEASEAKQTIEAAFACAVTTFNKTNSKNKKHKFCVGLLKQQNILAQAVRTQNVSLSEQVSTKLVFFLVLPFCYGYRQY